MGYASMDSSFAATDASFRNCSSGGGGSGGGGGGGGGGCGREGGRLGGRSGEWGSREHGARAPLSGAGTSRAPPPMRNERDGAASLSPLSPLSEDRVAR